MRERFRKWLVNRGNEGASKSYPGAVNRVSKHYAEKTGVPIDIYQLNDSDLVRAIADKYKQSGIYSSFGYEGNALFRNAIGRYAEFLSLYLSGNDFPTPDDSVSNGVEEDIVRNNNFTYERDLQYSLCNQIPELFPEYQIFGNNNEGVEYSIGGKRIDLLLEHEGNQSLLAIELKSGVALQGIWPNVDVCRVAQTAVPR